MKPRVPMLKKHRQIVRRALRFEHLEARYVLDGQAALAGDVFTLRENGQQVALDVLANDIFGEQYLGERSLTSVSFGSQGGRIEIAEDKQSVLYTPPADFFGTETFVYAVDGAYTAQVTLTIEAPLRSDNYEVAPDGVERTLDLLANDPFWTDYVGLRKITAVSVGSVGGTISIAPDGRSVRYTPPTELFGKETFIYVVDEIYRSQVTIEIPPTLRGDVFQIIQHAPPTRFDVLANDPFWSGAGYTGARTITGVIASQSGATVQIASDGKSIVYTPADNGNSTDTFRYVVDGAYEAQVTVYIHRPVRDDMFEVDEGSSNFFFDVTLNDLFRYVGGDQADVIDKVTSVTQSEKGGFISISADGKGVHYTAPVGFTGRDTFTYLADGVHLATVYVDVTRPVRDDEIRFGVYQDTPTNVVDVMSNDFLGNGYNGPRMITAVGPTVNGGTITIRADGKAILYTPAAGYTGEDRFNYTVDGKMQADVRLVVQALATPDSVWFYPDPNHEPYAIDVLANDFFGRGYTGPGQITSIEWLRGDGRVSIQDGRMVLFDPSSAGSHSFRYVVDGQYEGTVSVWIHQAVNPDRFVVDQNSRSQSLSVLANDFRPFHNGIYYPGARQITGVTQSQHGGTVTISADGRSVQYEPAVDFHGEDNFTYTVDGFTTANVVVEVIRRVRDDQFRVDAGDGQQRLPVLVNDLFGANYAGPGQITLVSAASGGGRVNIGDDGHSILYTPASGFVGTDTFIYTVDGALKAEVKVVVDAPTSDQAGKFGSLESYQQFLLEDALARYEHLFGQTAWPGWLSYGTTLFTAAYDADASSTRNHSETNVQVAGIDEGDIVEFDDQYVYTLSSGELVIVNAWPADELSVASRFDIEGRPVAQFLHGDRLTVISEVGGYYGSVLRQSISVDDFNGIGANGSYRPGQQVQVRTIVTVLDVSDRTSPTVVQKTEMEGKYVDSRGIGDFVYVLVNNINAVGQAPQIIDEDNNPETPGRYETRDEYLARVLANPGQFIESALPNYTTYNAAGDVVRSGLLNSPEDIYRPLASDASSLISVISFNVESDEPGLASTSAVYSTGASTVYASLDNFYVLDNDTSAEDGAVTRIVKFDWEPSTGGIEFVATTTIAGTILNQFSLDEHEGNLRIATTVSNFQSGNWSGGSENMLFVLLEDDGIFESVGSLQNLALNESIRSVRFLGNRAFVTTFRDVDPLFAIDLSNPSHPKSVGHITLPGFTSYMHLIDEDHLLTVGKNTPRGTSGPTQVSLFDISDLSQPRRVAEYTFERFTTSEAEVDHHAFGYYAEHGLLAMPVAQERIERIDVDGDGYRETRQTVRENLLAVFSVDVHAVTPAGRLELSGVIEHDTAVSRSGYIADKLYSISSDSIKVVDVSSPEVVLAEVNIEGGFNEISVTPNSVLFEVATLVNHSLKDDVLNDTGAPLARAVDAARQQLAQYLGTSAGAPLFVTAEVVSDASSNGFLLVFQINDRHYLYCADANGNVALTDDDFAFNSASTWHEVQSAWVAIEKIGNEAGHGATSPVQATASETPAQIPAGSLDGNDSSVHPWTRAANRQALGFPRNSLSRMGMGRVFELESFTSPIDGDLLLALARQATLRTDPTNTDHTGGTDEFGDSAVDDSESTFATLGERLDLWGNG